MLAILTKVLSEAEKTSLGLDTLAGVTKRRLAEVDQAQAEQ